MAQLRIALAQTDITVGDLAANAATVESLTRRAVDGGAHLVLFPEMTLTGYPPEDLVFRDSFQQASKATLSRLAKSLGDSGLGECAVIVGYLDHDGGPKNAAALLYGGEVVVRYYKRHLPNYGVFDEARYFTRGEQLPIVRLHGVDIALTICEDLWQDGGPAAVAGQAGAGLIVCINGSPYERNKDDVRFDVVRQRAVEAGTAIAYVNIVGAQDELVYDGDSLVVDAGGRLVARAPQFEPTVMLVDLDLPGDRGDITGPVLGMTVVRKEISDEPVAAYEPRTPEIAERLSDEAEVYAALVTGTRDYVRKNGMRRVYLGLSGGIDSTLTAAIACDAIGAENVYGISNPSVYSTQHSRDDAAELARRTGLNYLTMEIAPVVDAVHQLAELDGLAAENLQARIRGLLWMAMSNQHDPSIVLACGNKSELAVGYSTLYGDTVGGFAPIKDVPKTLVWKLARWRNDEAEKRGEQPPIPENSISKPPSAELRPDQLDSDSLPNYEILDALLEDYVDRDLGWSALIERGHDPETIKRVIRMVDRAEYKRRQYPPGPKISVRAFGRDRRLPITSRWQEKSPESV